MSSSLVRMTMMLMDGKGHGDDGDIDGIESQSCQVFSQKDSQNISWEIQ